MKTLLNLAYGSNLHRARIEARVEIQSTLGMVVLPNWGLRFHKIGTDGSGKCNLVPSPGETAYGVVYAFSAKNKSRLDKIEGVGKGYENIALPLSELDIRETKLKGDEQLFAYLAIDTDIDDELLPYDWYHGFVRQGAEQCGFPAEYLSYIERVPYREDEDERRRKENLRLLSYPRGD